MQAAPSLRWQLPYSCNLPSLISEIIYITVCNLYIMHLDFVCVCSDGKAVWEQQLVAFAYLMLTVVCKWNWGRDCSSRGSSARFSNQQSATIDREVVNESRVSVCPPNSCWWIDRGLLLSFCVTGLNGMCTTVFAFLIRTELFYLSQHFCSLLSLIFLQDICNSWSNS